MATQTRTRSTAKTTAKRPPNRTTPPEEPWREQISSQWAELRRHVQVPGVPHRYRRECAIAILLFTAAMAVYTLARPQDGVLFQWANDSMHWWAGEAAFLIPLFLILMTIRAVREQDGALLLPRHVAGAAALTASITGLFAYSGATTDDNGGVIGTAVADLAALLIDEAIAAVILFSIGIIGVFLLCGMNPLTLGRECKRLLLPSRQPHPFIPEPVKAVKLARKQEPELVAKVTATRPIDDFASMINIPAEEVASVSATPNTKIAVEAVDITPLPDLSRLAYYAPVELESLDLERTAGLIEETLASFKVDARVREINPGPAVTQFTLEPGQGVKVRRITELQNDLALALAAPSVRIEAPVPGMARVGVEIPNPQVATVGLRETLESQGFAKSKAKLPIPLGRDVNGRYAVYDLAKMPHVLIAGSTGSGKSVCLNTIISTFLLNKRPDEVRMLMIDPKMVELTGYNGVPHLQTPVITESDKVVGALRLVVQEMQRRYDVFNKAGVRNLEGYRMKMEDEPNAERVPYLVVIVDELADLMLTSPVEVESLLQRLAQMGRACGIHLILATQRPSVDVITGVIKANVPARIAFAVASLADSRVILDLPGAERLLGRGDMLFLPPDAAKPSRIQGAFVEDKDLQYIVGHWHSVAPIPAYPREWIDLPSSNSPTFDEYDDDPLMERALEIVKDQGTASASMLQRRLRIGYNRAARLIEQMEADGVIGPADGVKGRPVLLGEW